MASKFEINPDIGLKVHNRPFSVEFEAFGKLWKFWVTNQAAANIAKGCLTYYKSLWDGRMFAPVDKQDVIVDIGAHMGFFSIPISSRVDHVHSFEPSPANAELLKRNLRRNHVENVWAHRVAVSDKDGTVQLSLGIQGTTGHSIVTRKRGGVTVDVSCISIGTVMHMHAPTIIKMDCEGAEWLILSENNMQYLNHVRAMVAELHFVKRNNLPALLSNLAEAGFTTWHKSESWFTILIAYK